MQHSDWSKRYAVATFGKDLKLILKPAKTAKLKGCGRVRSD